MIESDWASEAECKKTIKTCFEQNHYLLDPHTAVALNVALKRTPKSARKLLVTSTAHYSKFGNDVLLALGMEPTSESPCEVLKQLEELKAEPVMNQSLKNAIGKQEIQNNVCSRDMNALKQKVENFLKELKSI